MKADGSGLAMLDHIGGHPEWADGLRVIGVQNGRQVLYDVDTRAVVGTLGGPETFRSPEATSRSRQTPSGSSMATMTAAWRVTRLAAPSQTPGRPQCQARVARTDAAIDRKHLKHSSWSRSARTRPR